MERRLNEIDDMGLPRPATKPIYKEDEELLQGITRYIGTTRDEELNVQKD
jgi:hypothetical protein